MKFTWCRSGFITVNGVKTEVKKELKETYSNLRNAKLISGMYNNIIYDEKGVYNKDFDKETYILSLPEYSGLYVLELMSSWEGTAIIYNYLLEKAVTNIITKQKNQSQL